MKWTWVLKLNMQLTWKRQTAERVGRWMSGYMWQVRLEETLIYISRVVYMFTRFRLGSFCKLFLTAFVSKDALCVAPGSQLGALCVDVFRLRNESLLKYCSRFNLLNKNIRFYRRLLRRSPLKSTKGQLVVPKDYISLCLNWFCDLLT